MITVKTFNIEEFRSIKEIWGRLVLSMSRPSVFCTWEWVHTWFQHYGDKYKIQIVIVFKNGNIIGILPLCTRKMLLEDGLIKCRVMSLCGANEQYPDHLDMISDDTNMEECTRYAIEFLRKRDEWDVLHFSHVADNSMLLKYCKNLPLSCRDIHKVSSAPYISISDYHYDFEKYIKTLDRHKRHDLRRRKRVLANEFNIGYVRYNSSCEDNSSIQNIFDLHALRAKSKGIKSSFSGKASTDFHRDIARIFSERGWLQLAFLGKNDILVAGLYCFIFGQRLFAYQSGLDPDWERKGAGAVLLFDTIREAFEAGLHEFDFLRGGETYKNAWTTKSRELFNVYIYNSTIRSHLFAGSFRIRCQLKKLVAEKLLSRK